MTAVTSVFFHIILLYCLSLLSPLPFLSCISDLSWAWPNSTAHLASTLTCHQSTHQPSVSMLSLIVPSATVVVSVSYFWCCRFLVLVVIALSFWGHKGQRGICAKRTYHRLPDYLPDTLQPDQPFPGPISPPAFSLPHYLPAHPSATFRPLAFRHDYILMYYCLYCNCIYMYIYIY